MAILPCRFVPEGLCSKASGNALLWRGCALFWLYPGASWPTRAPAPRPPQAVPLLLSVVQLLVFFIILAAITGTLLFMVSCSLCGVGHCLQERPK